MQRGRVILYASRKLTPHEVRYPTYDLELGAVVFDLNILRHYLYGVRCTIYMDHTSLRYLMDHPNVNMRHHKWIDMMKDYNYEILYHLGKANAVADALSRKLACSSIASICMRIYINSLLMDLIREARAEGIKKEN